MRHRLAEDPPRYESVVIAIATLLRLLRGLRPLGDRRFGRRVGAVRLRAAYQPLDRLLDLLDRATDEFLQFTPWGLSGGYYYARVNYTWGR